ncbi:hypothetical protein G9A89_013588 [Geosiphon pyriformis]|nr:hypothetical protein G9A89_013588 [Geosiphon pyriformis]
MPDPNDCACYKSTETEHPQKYIKVATIGTIGKDHSSYGKALFQYFRKDLGIPAGTAYAESDFCNYINAKIDCLTNPSKLTRVLNIQQPVESDSEEYENKFNNSITAQAKSMVNKKPRVLSPTTPSYHQTSQIGNTTNSWKSTPLESTQLDQITRRIRIAVWKSYSSSRLNRRKPINLGTATSTKSKETAILQLIGLSDKGKQLVLAPGEHSNTRTPIPLNITSNTPPINWIMAYRDIAKLEKFSGEEDNAYFWIADTEKAITANIQALPFFLTGTTNSWYQSLTEKPTSFTEFKLAFLQYFCDSNTLIRLQNQFSIIKQKDHKAVTTYLRRFNQILHQILVIERNYYTVVQVFNQFIKELQSSILRSIRPRHLTSLQDAVTFACNFESAEQKANHTQAPELQELTNHPNGEKITTTADTHSNRTVSNSNNLGDPIPTTATTARNLNTSPVTAEERSWTKIKKIHTSNPDISKTCPSRSRAINYNQRWRNPNNNQVQTNSGPSQLILRSPAQSRPIPTGYLNQASYLSLMEDQGFDKSTPVEDKDIK